LLHEDIYERAEPLAAAHGTTLGQQTTQLLWEFADRQAEAAGTVSNSAVSRLFAALDKGRNVKPVGLLRRDELYNRDILG
jgi:hypothetical protein